jgi:hypothetical protein
MGPEDWGEDHHGLLALMQPLTPFERARRRSRFFAVVCISVKQD